MTTDLPSANSLVAHTLEQLTIDNYTQWSAQFVSYLKGQKLFGYIDGSFPCPSPTNPEYEHWCQQDNLILSALLSSITESMIGDVAHFTTSYEVWSHLENIFASQSQECIVFTRIRLAMIKKNNLSIVDYVQKVQSLVDQLRAAKWPITDAEVISHILEGLRSSDDYDDVVTAISTSDAIMSIDDVKTHLLAKEIRLEQNSPQLDLRNPSVKSPSENSTTNTRYSNSNLGYYRGRGGRGRGGRGGRGRGFFI